MTHLREAIAHLCQVCQYQLTLKANSCWDPGGDMAIRNDCLHSIVSAATQQMDTDMPPDLESRTDLDSYANMPMVDAGAFVIAELGRTCNVSPYSPDYLPMKSPLVDAAVKYESPFDGKEYILVIRNVYVLLMRNNLIPAFMIRDVRIRLRDTPKIHVVDPSEDNHAIVFPETVFTIPLSLWGTFSYFPMTKPTMADLDNPDEVYLLPTS